jgi:hypothetical protein
LVLPLWVPSDLWLLNFQISKRQNTIPPEEEVSVLGLLCIQEGWSSLVKMDSTPCLCGVLGSSDFSWKYIVGSGLWVSTAPGSTQTQSPNHVETVTSAPKYEHRKHQRAWQGIRWTMWFPRAGVPDSLESTLPSCHRLSKASPCAVSFTDSLT